MPEPLNPLDLRDARSDDLEFLFHLYCDVRGAEVAAWGWSASQTEAFLRMQFDAQRRGYEAAYPQANDLIVLSGGEAIGRRLSARTSEGMHLVDIALLGAHRNRGLGTRLIRQLMDECEVGGAALHLHVLRGNPAMRLYQRMGFRESGADAMYLEMEWTPGETQPS
jgi:ribosomal protein S18 acetylase RimI-like enzyme